ncbi:MAG TPA: hypothetical protein VFK05_11000 [Polyangiaceae bacterium]|nr:hypothetical protein [Polyangiaceae bacterium]
MKLVKPGELAQRSLGLVASVANYVQATQAGVAPSPLLLLVRSANQLAARIAAQPSSVPTPSQRRTLAVLAVQLRAMTSRIIVSTDARDPKSLEAELSELVRRTLELVERVSAEPPPIDAGKVVDVEVIEE